jgi:hypothetical protein
VFEESFDQVLWLIFCRVVKWVVWEGGVWLGVLLLLVVGVDVVEGVVEVMWMA